MKKIFKITAFILVIYSLKAQDTLPKIEYKRIYVELGSMMPIGDFKSQMSTTINYGFWFRTQLKHNDYMDIGFNFWIPKNHQPIEINFKNQTHIYESTDFVFSLGGRLSKVILKNKNTDLEWVTGFGFTILTYQTPNTVILTEQEKEDKEGPDNAIVGFYLAQGLRINYKNIGLQAHYQYVPIQFSDSGRKGSFGINYITFGIIYKQ